MRVTNVYRGLYPIKNVKQHFKKKTIDNRKLYICLWPDCSFQTWKYSQHISRHIYLKHIGIKELRCSVPACEKVFKRPESLVQHVKNHICGFGIDPVRMKDAANICGVKNIKRHFSKIMDNDIQVFMCQFARCQFVTNNSGSIRRHVHNQHICPHSSPNGNGGNGSSNGVPRASTPSSRNNGGEAMMTSTAEAAIISRSLDSSPNLQFFSSPRSQGLQQQQQFSPHSQSPASSVNSADNSAEPPVEEVEEGGDEDGNSCSAHLDPLVVLTEYEGQTYDPVARSINHETSISNYSTDHYANAPNSPMDLSGPSMRGLSIPASLNRIDEDEDDEEVDEEEIEEAEEEMPMTGEHSMKMKQSTQQQFLPHGQGAGLFSGGMPPLNSFGASTSNAAALNMQNYLLAAEHQQQQLLNSLPQPVSQLLDPDAEAAAAAAAAAARRKNNGLYSLKNYKEHYYKIKTEEAGVQFICKGCQFQAKSQITLIRHLWNELGYKEFHCEFEGCTRTFDNEFSRYKHRKFDHGQPTQPPGAVIAEGDGSAALPSAAGGDDRSCYSPMPALVPISLQVPPVPSGSSPHNSSNSSYSVAAAAAAAAMLNLGAHKSSQSSSPYHHLPTPYSSHHYQQPSSSLSPSRSLVVPPSSHHLASILPPNSFSSSSVSTIPVAAAAAASTTSTGSTFPMGAATSASGHSSSPSPSSSRRHSNGSLTDSMMTNAINSSLISILQAPSMAASSNGGTSGHAQVHLIYDH